MNCKCFVSLIVLSACAAHLPSYIADPSRHQRFPVSRFVTASGISANEMIEAETKARTEVAAQIRSRITSSAEHYYEQLDKKIGGVETMFREYHRTVRKTILATGFDKAELIRIDRRSSGNLDGTYYAFAYLSREEIAADYRLRYNRREISFVTLCRQTLTAWNTGDVQSFQLGFTQISALYRELLDLNAGLRAIGMDNTRRQQGHDAVLLDLIGKQFEWNRRCEVGLTLTGSSTADRRPFWFELMAASFARFGLKTRPDAEKGPDRAIFRLDVKEDCRQRYIGHHCELRLSARLDGSAGETTSFDFDGPTPAGDHPSDPARALDKAYSAIDPEQFVKELETKLVSFLPIVVDPQPNTITPGIDKED